MCSLHQVFDGLKSLIDVCWLSETMAAEMMKILIKWTKLPNYVNWKVQCKIALIKEGLWNIVWNENAPESQGEQAKYLLWRDCALATIVLSVDWTLLYLLGPDSENPVVVWRKLADEFQKKAFANRLVLWRKWYNLKLKDEQSIQKHVKMLTEIFDELFIIGDPIDEENQVVHLLANLPESYDMLVTAFEASPEVPKLEIVTEGLLHKETKQRDKESSTIEVKAKTSKHQISRKGPKCYHFGRFEQIKREYRILLEHPGKNQDNRTTSCSNKKLLRKQKANAAEEDTDHEGEEIVGLVTEHALSTNRRSNWNFDSGATCHMCNNEELFDRIIGFEMPQEIAVGDGHSVQATG